MTKKFITFTLVLLCTTASIFGASAEQKLGEFAASERKGRHIEAALGLVAGSVMLAIDDNNDDDYAPAGYTNLAGGLLYLSIKTPAEKAHINVQSLPESERNDASVKAFHSLRKTYRNERIYGNLISSAILFAIIPSGSSSRAVMTSIPLVMSLFKSKQEKHAEALIEDYKGR